MSLSEIPLRYYRCSLLDINVVQAKDVIAACKNMLSAHAEEEQNQLILCMKTLMEAFRFLRNCCAETPKNQNSIVYVLKRLIVKKKE